MASTKLLRSSALLAIPATLAVILGIVVFVRRSEEVAPNQVPKSKKISVEPGGAERALLLRDFRRQHAPAINTQITERSRNDPSYSKALLSIDEGFVQSLQGFDEAEKRELWQTVRAAQEAVRHSSPPRSN